MQDVTSMVTKANDHAVKKFSTTILKNAHQEINGRQNARLEMIKEQMKDSLYESKLLNEKLKTSYGLKKVGEHQGHTSEFTELVLGFSDKLENYAADLIEATATKKRNKRMKSMMQQIQKNRKLKELSETYSQSSRGRSRRGSMESNFSSQSKRSLKSFKSNRSGRSRVSKKSRRSGSKRSRSAKRSGSRSARRSRSRNQKLSFV